MSKYIILFAGLYLDDVRRPVYRGNLRYNPNSNSFVKEETLVKTNDSYLISLKLIKNQKENIIKNDLFKSPLSNLSDVIKKGNLTYLSPNNSINGNGNDSLYKRDKFENDVIILNNNFTFRRFKNNVRSANSFNETSSDLSFTGKKLKNRIKIVPIRNKGIYVNNKKLVAVNDLTNNRSIISTRIRKVGGKKKVRVRVKKNNQTSKINSPDNKFVIMKPDENKFISDSMQIITDLGKEGKLTTVNQISGSSNNATKLWQSVREVVDSVNRTLDKRPILIYPQGQPPNWTEHHHDPSFILVEDILDPELLPKPYRDTKITEHSSASQMNSSSVDSLKEYLYYLTSSYKPSKISVALKPDLMSNQSFSGNLSDLNYQTSFEPVRVISKPNLEIQSDLNAHSEFSATPEPILIPNKHSNGQILQNILFNGTSTSDQVVAGSSTNVVSNYIHVSTISPHSPLNIKPTGKPQILISSAGSDPDNNNKQKLKRPYYNFSTYTSHYPNHHSPIKNPTFDYTKIESSGWSGNKDTLNSGTWTKPSPIGTGSRPEPEVTTGSWVTITEGEKLERPVHFSPQTTPLPEHTDSHFRPVYTFRPPQTPTIEYPKPANFLPAPTFVQKPLYVYVPPPSTPIYKPVFAMPYPQEKEPTSASVTPAPLPVGVSRPSADELAVPAVQSANPPLGPTIILAPPQDEPPVPSFSRPPAPSIVIIDSFSDPPLSDDPLDVSPLQDPIPEDCRSVLININGSNSSALEETASRNCPLNIIINNMAPQSTSLADPAITPMLQPALGDVLPPAGGLIPPLLPDVNLLSNNNLNPVTQSDVTVTTTNKPSSSSSYADYFYSILPLFNPLLYPLFFVFLGPIKVLVLGAFILAGFLFPVMIFRGIIGLFLG